MSEAAKDCQKDNMGLEMGGDSSSRESGVLDVTAAESGEGSKELNEEEFTAECGCGPTEGVPNEELGAAAVLENDNVSSGGTCDKRSDVKKQHGFDAATAQNRRRQETLQWQKQRRDEILDKIRQLEDSAYSDSETEDEADFVKIVRDTSQPQETLEEITEDAGIELMDATTSHSKGGRTKKKNKSKNKSRRNRPAPCKVMLSEWLLDKPEDFEEMWLGAVCPVGKRCIVMASRGKTKIFSRLDEYMGSYNSLLPGGCRYNYRDSTTNRNRGVTILDCIWSQESQTFYVLDMICWNSHSCVNCDTDYRQFFLHSKFLENEELLERSPLNPFPFKPLPYFSARELPLIMASSITFPENVDGVLFIHREAFYISETNPLCLWILLTQVETILSVWVTPELIARQVKPKNLSSRRKQIKQRNPNMEVNENE